jgi:hypothetical protein
VKKIKILYIAGTSRSGSTILGNIISTIDNAIDVGEVRYIADRGVSENWQCSCGNTFHDCKFWNEVIKEGFGSIDKINPIRWLEQSERGIRLRYWLFSTEERLIKTLNKRGEYLFNLRKLYGAILNNNEADLIVDSSKDPTYGYLLTLLPNVEVYFIHLVRRPQAVLYSQVKRKKEQVIRNNTKRKMGTSFFLSLFHWIIYNQLIDRLLSKKNNYIRITYEQFTENPIAILEKVFANINIPSKSIKLTDGFKTKKSHVFSGNPSRFSNKIEIKQDDEWNSGLGYFQKFVIFSATFWKTIKYY